MISQFNSNLITVVMEFSVSHVWCKATRTRYEMVQGSYTEHIRIFQYLYLHEHISKHLNCPPRFSAYINYIQKQSENANKIQNILNINKNRNMSNKIKRITKCTYYLAFFNKYKMIYGIHGKYYIVPAESNI